MNKTSVPNHYTGLSRVKLFFALSRTPHGLLDITTPAFSALLWLGSFPPLKVIILGLITAFAGYTAVYALNDIIDYRNDKKKLQQGGFMNSDNYLDGVTIRHPLAHGLLSFKEGLLWSIAWALLAVIGAFILNPVCLLIFIIGCLLETFYCLMWRISHLRTIISGAVKTSGGMAAVFAVDPNPSPLFLFTLFLCLFFWEIGGQNIPADWTDIEEDRLMNAKTIPVRFGPAQANVIILSCLVLAIVMSVVLFHLSQVRFETPYVIAVLFVGLYLLFFPAFRLYKTKNRLQAIALFNKASYYPMTLLLVVVIKLFT